MKQIISNILYDTEKSELLLIYYPGDTFGYHLYQSKSGRFFQEKRDTSALFTEPTKLISLSQAKVKQILSQHDTDLYIKLFGSAVDSNDTAPMDKSDSNDILLVDKNSFLKKVFKYFFKK